MWEIAAIISKEISEKDAKQHFKSMITLGKVEFCMDKFEKATTLKNVGIGTNIFWKLGYQTSAKS